MQVLCLIATLVIWICREILLCFRHWLKCKIRGNGIKRLFLLLILVLIPWKFALFLRLLASQTYLEMFLLRSCKKWQHRLIVSCFPNIEISCCLLSLNCANYRNKFQKIAKRESRKRKLIKLSTRRCERLLHLLCPKKFLSATFHW